MALLQKLKKHWFEALLVVAFGGYVIAAQSSQSCPATLVGNWLTGGNDTPEMAPAWQMPTLDEQTLSSEGLSDQVVVLNFWATWCGPCRAELPDFVEMQREYTGEGVQFVGANIEGPEKSPAVQQMARQYGLNFPVTFADASTMQQFGGVRLLPTTLVISPDGRIIKRFEGRVRPGELKRSIESARTSL